VNAQQQAVLLNAVPLLAVAALYLTVAAALARSFRHAHARLRDPELSLALVFPAVGVAAAVLGAVLLVDREPLGNAWVALGAIALAAVPALAFLLNWKQREILLSASSRAREAEERATEQQRARQAVNEYTSTLARLDDLKGIGRRLTQSVADLLGVDFSALVMLEGHAARGVYGRLDGREVPWWPDLRLDLDEPSAIASAAFEAAPFAVYDVESSPYVNRNVADQVGAKSGVWVPLVSGEKVIGVLAVATTRERRAFAPEDVALLQELAAETALALARVHSGELLEGALERERLVARISQKVRSELDLGAVLDVAVTETAAALGVVRCFIRLGGPGEPMPIAGEWTDERLEAVGDRALHLPVSNLAARERRTVAVASIETDPQIEDPTLGGRETDLELGSRSVLATPLVVFDSLIGVLALHRTEPGEWAADEIALAEAVAHEVSLAIHTARLLDENARRLQQQSSLLEAAHVLTSELRPETVLQRLVDEVAGLLGGDAADCYLVDARRGVLRCAAVKGLPGELVGFEIETDAGLSGQAVGRRQPAIARDYGEEGHSIPHAAYAEFRSAIVAPIPWEEEVRGVLGVGSHEPDRFDESDADVLEAFAGLASLALRNAEAFEERSRQARIQRGFYRIAAALGQPLSLEETLEAMAQAATEALGGSFAAVFMPEGGSLALVAAHRLPAALEPDPALEAAAEAGRILASPDVGVDERFAPDWRERAAEASCRSLLAVPVEDPRNAGEHGLVLVCFAETHRFEDEDLELARQMAHAARGALERSALFEEERAARTLAQQLARTGALLATELDPAAVLDEVVRQAPSLVGVEACAIRVLDGDDLVLTAVECEREPTDLIGTRSPATVRLSGDVIQSRSPVALEDASEDERLSDADPLLGEGYRGFLGVPLTAPEGAVHGVLAVYSRRPRSWRPDEIEALTALAANASSALSNAELYQRVALEKERSFAILENIADGIVAVDREGGVVLWNTAAEEITGVPAEETLGHKPVQVLGRGLESESGSVSGDRLLPILRGGEEVWLSLTEAVMLDPSGAVAGRIFAFRDISAERVVEQMKSEFVSTVSQEIRRPLTSIYGFAETLLRRDVLFGEEERRTFLGYIASESERLTSIVDALLNVARLDAGDLQMTVVPTDVGSVVSEVVETLTRAAGGANEHRFVVDLPDEPVSAEADPEKLRQVLQNLIDNAVKFSPGGGTVTVAARRSGARVEVSVADEGIGIPAGEHARIFRKFYRGDAAGVRESLGGTGLGLFIAEGLVAAMGGRIWVSSHEGPGASFTFELPAAGVPPGVSEPAQERVPAERS
jgi:PAS domain S-box-containing protein